MWITQSPQVHISPLSNFRRYLNTLASRLKQERLIGFLLLSFAVIFNLYHLYPEVALNAPMLNDGVLHLLAVEQTAASLAAGHNPADFWLATVGLGYPLFHYYQHLGYLVPALLHNVTGLPVPALFHWTRLVLLSLFPLSIYGAMRRLGFDELSAAMAGLVSPLLAAPGLLGFDWSSYVWRGSGLYTQLWGMVLLPPALAQGYVTLHTGRGYVWTTLWLAATLLAHLVCGYIAIVSLLIFVVSGSLGHAGLRSFWLQSRRLILLLGLLILVTAYFLLPFWLDKAYMNRSVWEAAEKYNSYGHEWVLDALVKGDLLDFGRFPTLTLLAGFGMIICLSRWREERYRLPVMLTLGWLALYCGRPTWGVLLNLLPLSQDLHFHRLIAGVHLGSIYLAGLGLAVLWRWCLAQPSAVKLLMTATLTALLLYPVYTERGEYLAQNTRWMAESQTALITEGQDIAALVATLRELPPGRVYAGLGNNWGRTYTVGAVPMYALLNSTELDLLGYLYHALSLNADIQVLFDETRPEHYNLFNVRYVVAPIDHVFPDFVKPIRDFGRHRLYEVETSGYFELVETNVGFTGDKSELYPAASLWLNSDLVRSRQHPAILLEPDANWRLSRLPLSQAGHILPQLTASPGSIQGQITAETVGSGRYAATVEIDQESTLLLKSTYHPNWHAYIDGLEVTPMMVMPAYVGVRVPPGSHEVRLIYQPRPLRGVLMIAGLLTLPLIALVERRQTIITRWIGRSLPGHGPKIPTGEKLLLLKKSLALHLPYLSGLLLLTLLAGLPLFQFKIMSGHDALEYLPRTVEFYEGLKAGQVFPRWAPDLSAGYGQPFFNFNPPLFYYVTALFHALGFEFVAAQNLALFALLLFAGVSMYILAEGVFGQRGGLVAAAAYLFAPYLLVTLYVRHALADFSAFAFIPMTLWGLYHFSEQGRYRYLLIGALSLGGLILSSNPVALITFPGLGLLTIWVAWSERGKGFSHVALCFGRSGWYLGLGLGLPAFFWLPALFERGLVQTGRLLADYLNYQNHFVYLFQLIYSPWGYGLSWPGPDDGMSFAVGTVHLILAGVAIFLLRRRQLDLSKRAKCSISFFLILLGGAIFFATTESLLLWERLSLLQYLEFPWRFMSLVAVSTAFLCGVPFLMIGSDNKRLANGLMLLLIGAIFFVGFPKAHPASFLNVTAAAYSPEIIAARNISVTTAREYEPVWIDESPRAPASKRLSLLQGSGQIVSTHLSPVHYEFQVAVDETSRLRLNTFYFPGWVLYIDGLERTINYNNPQGVMEFLLEPGQHLVRVSFMATTLRQWSTRVSLLALGLLILTPLLVVSKTIKLS